MNPEPWVLQMEQGPEFLQGDGMTFDRQCAAYFMWNGLIG